MKISQAYYENFARCLEELGLGILRWYGELNTVRATDLVRSRKDALRTAVFSADMINGFCKDGALASRRVDAISAPVADLFGTMHGVGVSKFVLLQEGHDEHAKEFGCFPPHGITGTREADTILEILELPFSDKFMVFRKNALTPAFARRRIDSHSSGREQYESFEHYVKSRSIETAIVVGNCTDLCVRELAMYLRMWANQHQKDMRIIIPQDCVETFDMPFEVAGDLGVMPHPGDVYHLWALYEMARNGIDVVKKIV